MNTLEQYHCTCGAVGDRNDLIGHAIEKFELAEDTTDHVLIGLEEPASVTEARARWQRLVEVQAQLEQVVGASIEEIRRALAA